MERFYRKQLFCLLISGAIFLLSACEKKEKLSTIPLTEVPHGRPLKTLKPLLPPEPLLEEEIENNKDKIGKFEFGEGKSNTLREERP